MLAKYSLYTNTQKKQTLIAKSSTYNSKQKNIEELGTIQLTKMVVHFMVRMNGTF